jgi:outer membrane biosynthesis protein TonB
MKRFSAVFYYFLMILIPLMAVLTVMQVKTPEVQGGELSPTPEPEWRTICHVTGYEEIQPIRSTNVNMATQQGISEFNFHFGETNQPAEGQPGSHDGHVGDVWFEGKDHSCPGDGTPTTSPTESPEPTEEPEGTPTPNPTNQPELTPTQTPTPSSQPTVTIAPTQPPAATATPKPEDNKKSMDISKNGPTCEERTFSVSVQLKDDGKEIKDQMVTFSYLSVSKQAKTNDQGRAGVDLDYAGKGEVRAEAEGWPTARATVDELICDGAVLGTTDGDGEVMGASENGQVLGYASTGASTESLGLLIESMGMALMMIGAVKYLAIK